MTELERLRREHAEHGVGPELARLLEQVVRATAPTYPPAEYSDARVWSREAIEDALHDWATTRLIERGDLAVMLGSAGSVASLRRMLTRSFGQHLTNRRLRTSATNLYQRTVVLLRRDTRFQPVGVSRSTGTQLWTLASAPSTEPAAADVVDKLIKAASTRSDDELGVVRYGPYSLKSSPILRNPALGDFLAFLLDRADGCLSTVDLFQVIRHRFNLADIELVELDMDMAEPLPGVAAQVEQDVLAGSVLARLGGRQAVLVRAFQAADGDPRAAAATAGVAVGDVAAAVDRLLALIADYAESADEAIAVYNRITESLFLQSEDL